MEYYLGRWEWRTARRTGWCAPQNAIGLLDLRSTPQQSLAGGTPQGYGFFAYPAPVMGLAYYIGNGVTILTNAKKTAIRNRLGTTALASTNILDLLFELLSLKADPTGQLRWRPLMPGIDGQLKLYLGGHSLVREETYNPAQHPLVLEALKEDYRRLRQEFQAIGSDHYRRVLQVGVEQYGKFGLAWKDFIPADLPQETPLPHSTVITESFNKADSDILGPDLSWTELKGDFDVVSNQAKSTLAGSSAARADSPLASANHYAQETWQAEDVGNMVRKDSTTTFTCYGTDVYTSGYDEIWKEIAGVYTSLVTGATLTMTPGDIIKLEANGSTIRLLRNSTQVESVTDTSITGNTYTGIIGYDAAGILDNFQAGDLTVAFRSSYYYRLYGMGTPHGG